MPRGSQVFKGPKVKGQRYSRPRKATLSVSLSPEARPRRRRQRYRSKAGLPNGTAVGLKSPWPPGGLSTTSPRNKGVREEPTNNEPHGFSRSEIPVPNILKKKLGPMIALSAPISGSLKYLSSGCRHCVCLVWHSGRHTLGTRRMLAE